MNLTRNLGNSMSEEQQDLQIPYMVFGHPIAHSRSPFIHQLFAEQTDIEHHYSKYCIELSQFDETIEHYFSHNGKGANITVPFKEQAFRYVTHLTPEAKAAGAVNTIRREANGELIGHNTDGIGLMSDLKRLGFLPTEANVLLLGAGGASRGVILPLLQQGAHITLVNRTIEKAKQLANEFNHLRDTLLSSQVLSDVSLEIKIGLSSQIRVATYDELNTPLCDALPNNSQHRKPFDLIINATSASINGAIPEVAKHCFNHNTAVYDMFYAKTLTPFLHYFIENGVDNVADGLGMLVEQAAYAFEFWHGVLPSTYTVLNALRKQISA